MLTNHEYLMYMYKQDLVLNNYNGGNPTKSSILEKNNSVPTPGIEPGPPGWKPGILTTRPYGKTLVLLVISILFIIFTISAVTPSLITQ